jgi:transcriptional regulator with XRE-family HTH domain
MLDAGATAQLVKRARKIRGLTQAEFGLEIHRPQSLVSKYERGTVEPPGHIVIHCMTIVGDTAETMPSTTDVARLIESRLGSSEFDDLRSALVRLIESVPAHVRQRKKSSKVG